MILKQEKPEMDDFEEKNIGSKGKILLLFQNILSIFLFKKKT